MEVGAWKGQSIIHLCQRLQGMEKTAKLYAVDTFSGDADTGKANVYPEFDHNAQAAGCSYNIIPVALPSVVASEGFDDASLAGAFIDAAHDYDSVLADLKAWAPKVKEGGIIAGHDIDAEGVQRALAEMGWEYYTVGRCWVKKNTKKMILGMGKYVAEEIEDDGSDEATPAYSFNGIKYDPNPPLA